MGGCIPIVLKFDRWNSPKRPPVGAPENAHRTMRSARGFMLKKLVLYKLSILSNILGSGCCVYLTIFWFFLVVFFPFFFARPVGLYGARVSVVCALSERGKGFLKEKNPAFFKMRILLIWDWKKGWLCKSRKKKIRVSHPVPLGIFYISKLFVPLCPVVWFQKTVFLKKWFIHVYLYRLTLKPCKS